MWNRPEVAHGLIVFLGDAGALAGDQRRGNLAAFAGEARADAGSDERAEAIDGSPDAQIPWRLACALERLDLADGIARRSEPVEPGLAPEVEAIGRDWLGRRAQRRFQRDRLAALDSCAFAADSVTRTRCGVSAGGKSPSAITLSVILAFALSRRS